MTLPAIAKSFQHRLKREYRMTDYSIVIQFLSDVQDDKFRKRLRSGTVKITVLYMALLGLISVAVLIASKP
jgi:hypothetical protein